MQYAWDRHERLSVDQHHLRLSSAAPAFAVFPTARQNIDADETIWFLRQLHDHCGRRVVLVWDRWSVHRAAAAYFDNNHPDWFNFEWLPSYAPELNPVEQCWNHTKYDDLANFIPDDIQHLHNEVFNSIDKLHHDQILLRSFFEYCKLPLGWGH